MGGEAGGEKSAFVIGKVGGGGGRGDEGVGGVCGCGCGCCWKFLGGFEDGERVHGVEAGLEVGIAWCRGWWRVFGDGERLHGVKVGLEGVDAGFDVGGVCGLGGVRVGEWWVSGVHQSGLDGLVRWSRRQLSNMASHTALYRAQNI